ncbi:MAG: hypothetical protein ACLRXQ_07735 [Phascolarctobacterium faecium]
MEERPDNYNKAITWNRRFNIFGKNESGNVFEVADNKNIAGAGE